MLPMGITVLDLSAYVGLLAVGAVTLDMLLGLLMAFRYSPHRSWPHRRFNYFRFHNWTGYIALAVSILHPVILVSMAANSSSSLACSSSPPSACCACAMPAKKSFTPAKSLSRQPRLNNR